MKRTRHVAHVKDDFSRNLILGLYEAGTFAFENLATWLRRNVTFNA